jgi:hypothetical protein
MSQTLLDRLPLPNTDGTQWRTYWSEEDRDGIVVAIAEMGLQLRAIGAAIENDRRADDPSPVREGVINALRVIQEKLMPILGPDALWPLSEAKSVFQVAKTGGRHPLIRLKQDPHRILLKDPRHIGRQTMAAATLDYFHGKLSDQTKKELAEKIAKAMGEGGFRVQYDNQRGPPSARTVQDWCNRYSPKTRQGLNPPEQETREFFKSFQAEIEVLRAEMSLEECFECVLANLTQHCRDAAEILPAA